MFRILIVEDDDAFRNVLVDALSDDYEVHPVASGEDALFLASDICPQIALVDVNMPGMDGYEVCRALKVDFPDLRVVFMSGIDMLERRAAAYDAGADDFMAKPFKLAELAFKLSLLQRVINDTLRLKEEMKNANEVALLAMTGTGEMGGVIDFIKRAGACVDIESLVKALVSATASTFRLTVSAQIRLNDEQKTLNSVGRASPLEAEMLCCQARDAERIYTSGQRMMINYPRVTLLIKDMPLADADRCGRLRDHLAIIVEAAETRIDGIALEQQTRVQQTVTLQTIASIQEVMGSLEAQHRAQSSASQAVLDELKSKVDNALIFLGLTDRQEETLMNLISSSADRAAAVHSEGLALDVKFETIISVLTRLQQTEARPTILADEPDDSIILF